MAAEKTDNKDRILDAMFSGKLTVRQEEPAAEQAAEEAPEREVTDEERRKRLGEALSHLMSGKAFRERKD